MWSRKRTRTEAWNVNGYSTLLEQSVTYPMLLLSSYGTTASTVRKLAILAEAGKPTWWWLFIRVLHTRRVIIGYWLMSRHLGPARILFILYFTVRNLCQMINQSLNRIQFARAQVHYNHHHQSSSIIDHNQILLIFVMHLFIPKVNLWRGNQRARFFRSRSTVERWLYCPQSTTSIAHYLATWQHQRILNGGSPFIQLQTEIANCN